MVQQQHTDEIDAFIRSLREKALERQRRSSIVETSLQEANRRIAEQQRLISRAAQGQALPAPAFRAPVQTAPSNPPMPPPPDSRPIASGDREDSARNAFALLESLNVQPAIPHVDINLSTIADPTDVIDAAIFEAPAVDPEYSFIDEKVCAPAPEVHSVEETPWAPAPAHFAEEPAHRLPDLSAMGVSWEPAGSFEAPVEESAAYTAVETPAPVREAAESGFVRSQAASHVFEPHAPQPLVATADEVGQAEPRETSSFRPITPLPLKPLPAAALPLKKHPAPVAEKPKKPDVVKLPFLEDGAGPQIQMIATAIQMAAKEHNDRAARPLPKFATMSAYDQTGGEEKVESTTAAPKSRMKVTMAGPKKRSFWPFGNKRAA